MLSPLLPRAAELPAVIDVEASGFGPGSYPVEVGFVLPDGRSWCSLVRPEPAWLHWDAAAQAVHRIARETVLRHGRPAADVARQLNERLQGRTVYCDGWAHDQAWLARLFHAAELAPSFRLEHLRRLLDDDDAARFGLLHRQILAEAGLPRHRASHDARLLQLTLRRLRQPARTLAMH
jgi:hypothetical protein